MIRWTRPVSWWAQRRQFNRARRQLRDESLPEIVAGSTINVQISEAAGELGRRLPPLAAQLTELRRLAVELGDRNRVRQGAKKAHEAASAAGYSNRLAFVVWLSAFVPVTGVETVLSKMLVDRLVPEAGDRLVWFAVAGVATLTLIVGHELGSMLRTWSLGQMDLPARRRFILAISYFVAYGAILNIGIAMTPTPNLAHVTVSLVLLLSTAYYSVKPSDEFIDRARLWFEVRLAERPFRATSVAATKLADRVVNSYNSAITFWWAECQRAQATPAAWGLDQRMPAPSDVTVHLKWIDLAGVVVARDDIDEVLAELSKYGIAVSAPIIVLRPRERRRQRGAA